MQVVLAGYNVDTSILKELENSNRPVTPETLAVAYARISRDSRPVTALRERAISDVDSARRSARSIIFDMNHQSVAEHAVFNFDILDISRLGVEALEWHRLCSYTEKSQRYQELMGDYIVPKEFTGEALKLFEDTVKEQNELYESSYKELLGYFKEKHPDMLEKKWDLRTVEGWAKEDARYCVSLATKAQLGFTANARNLEYLIRSLRSHPLSEVNELGDTFFHLAGEVAPSLILLTDPVEYEREFGRPLVEDHFTQTKQNLMGKVDELIGNFSGDVERTYPVKGDVKLTDWDPQADEKLLQALIVGNSMAPAEAAKALVDSMGPEEKKDLVKEALRFSNPWECATREFEAVDFTFEVVLSSACFGQMKRHRMSTQLLQDYDPGLGNTYPPSVVEHGLKDDFEGIYELTNAAFYELSKYDPSAAQYVLTNGHRRRMYLRSNARELYHIARLRDDAHAQWDIRSLSTDLISLAKEKAPLSLLLATGKDKFSGLKEEVYG